MTQQPSRQSVLRNTLAVLVHQVGMSPTDVANLRLSDLHLTGKKPNLTVHSATTGRTTTVELSMEAHRALVG